MCPIQELQEKQDNLRSCDLKKKKIIQIYRKSCIQYCHLFHLTRTPCATRQLSQHLNTEENKQTHLKTHHKLTIMTVDRVGHTQVKNQNGQNLLCKKLFYVELNSKHILLSSFYPKIAFLVGKNALLCLHWFLTNIQRKIFPNFKCIFYNYRCIFLEKFT